MVNLSEQVALVTGASRGVGRGVSLGLAHAGAKVFATGRSIKQAEFDSGITTIACDHTDDQAVAEVFRHIDETAGRLDILVNVAWGGYERMVEDGRFTWAAPFWEQPTWRWEAMVTAGVRRLSFRCPDDGPGAPRPDRTHLVLGGPEIRWQRDLRSRQGVN